MPITKTEDLVLSVLIMPYEDGYMAMCYETGIIRSGNTLDEAMVAIDSATRTLVKAVEQNSKLAPSLTIGLPLRYKILFNFTLFKLLTRTLFKMAMNSLRYETRFVSDFQPA